MSPKLSVIVPAYNEGQNILDVLLSLKKSLTNLGLVEYVIVDDGSKDSTADVLRQSEFWGKENYKFIFHEKNQGKGSAVVSALKEVAGDYVIIQDADKEYDPQDIPKIYDYAIKNTAPVVFGSRNLSNNKRGGFFFYWGGKFLSTLTNILYHQKITDEATGYKLVKREIIQSLPLTCRGFEFCPQLTAMVSKLGYKIAEVPITYNPRKILDGKKIKYRDGYRAVWELIRLKFVTQNNFWLFCLVAGFSFFLFLFTWGNHYMGYEYETADSAVSLLNGIYDVRRAGIGATIMYLPFAIIGKLLLGVGEQLSKLLTLVSVFYSALAVGFLFLSANLIVKKKNVALLFSVLIMAGSLVWPYSKIGMEYQAMFLLSIIFYLLLSWKNKPSLSKIWLVGFFLAFLALTKSYGIVFVLPAWLFMLVNDNKFKIAVGFREKVKQIFKANYFWIFGFYSALAIIITLLTNLLITKHVSGVYSLAHEFQVWQWWEGFYGIFFSAGKSIFIYSPLLILALFYWRKFIKQYKDSAVFILVSFILLLLITAPFSYWTDETLSVRKLVTVIPFLHFPLLVFWEQPLKIWWKKFLFIVLIVAGVYIQFINSLYPYWEQLYILRSSQQNTLSVLRYSPQLSHLAINHHLFKAFLLKDDKNFVYHENNWMNDDKKTTTYLKVNYDISAMKTPKLFWLRSVSQRNRVLFLSCWSVGFVAFNLFFWLNYSYYRKRE